MNNVAVDLHPYLRVPADRARDIYDGVSSHRYFQTGGVIKETGSNRIVAFLQNAGEGAKEAGTVVSSLASTALQIGAAASVLNLGVSVVSFVVLNRKLNQVQEGIRLLDAGMREGFDRLTGKLDDIGARMVGLHLLTAKVSTDLNRVEDKIDRVSAQIDLAQFAGLASTFEQLAEIGARRERPQPAWFVAHSDQAQRVRSYCVAMLARNDPARLGPTDPRFVASIAYLNVAALALVVEARTLRAAGETSLAKRRLELGVEQLRVPAAEIARQLCDRQPAILAAHQMNSQLGVPALASVARLLNPTPADPMAKFRAEWSEMVSSGTPEALGLLRSLRSEVSAWVDRMEAAHRSAEVIEMLMTLRDEYAVCEQHGLSDEQWERLGEAVVPGELILLAPRGVSA